MFGVPRSLSQALPLQRATNRRQLSPKKASRASATLLCAQLAISLRSTRENIEPCRSTTKKSDSNRNDREENICQARQQAGRTNPLNLNFNFNFFNIDTLGAKPIPTLQRSPAFCVKNRKTVRALRARTFATFSRSFPTNASPTYAYPPFPLPFHERGPRAKNARRLCGNRKDTAAGRMWLDHNIACRVLALKLSCSLGQRFQVFPALQEKGSAGRSTKPALPRLRRNKASLKVKSSAFSEGKNGPSSTRSLRPPWTCPPRPHPS